jgi:hypothetical protein
MAGSSTAERALQRDRDSLRQARVVARTLVLRRTTVFVGGAILVIAGVRVGLDLWNRDVSWLLYVSQRVLHGERLYTEVFENNPPLIVWFGIPFAAIGGALGIPAIDFFYAFILVAAPVVVWSCDRILARDLPAQFRGVFAVFLLAVLTVGPGFGFGERAHLMLLGCLPYLALLSARRSSLSPAARAASGLAAGFGLALKPFYLLIWLFALAAAVRRRGIRYTLALEHWAAAAVLLAYGLSVVAFTPYVSLLGVFYANYAWRAPYSVLVLRLGTALLAAAWLWTLLVPCRRRLGSLRDVFLTSATAAWFVMLLQGKGYPYHYYPVVALAGLVLVMGFWDAAASLDLERNARTALRTAASLVLVAGVLPLSAGLADYSLRQHAPMRQYIRTLLPVLKQYRSVAIFSQVLHAAFPLVSYAKVRWALPGPDLGFVGVYVRNRAGVNSSDRADLSGSSPVEERMRHRVVDALVATPPDLIIVDTPPVMWGAPVDYIGYLSTDPRFAALFEGYGFVEDIMGCRIYSRYSQAAAPAPAAAGGPCAPSW